MLKASPDPVDVQDLQFKLQCRLKIFDNKSLETFSKPYNVISCASRYGLLFLGTNSNSLQVIQLKCVESYSPKDKEVKNFPRRNIQLPSPAVHISVNCDSTIVGIVVIKDQCPIVLLYDVPSFLSANVTLIKELRLSSTPNVQVNEIGWNPTIPTILTACKNDGTLGVYEIKDNSVDINELPAASGANCFCWSPRGKQVAVGSKDGKITQYKPDLKAVKVINPPNFSIPHSLISLQWVSNFQFIGVYNGEQSCLVVVDAPKTGDTVYTNYDDICYSGSTRIPQFYMILQPTWNILLVASANGTEVGVMGLEESIWKQWIMEDSARAELPLSDDHEDTYPIGVALDTSATNALPWGESTIPPAPYLLVLSHQGLLSVFNVINLKSKDSICSAPDRVSDLSGLQLFTTESVENVTTAKTNPPSVSISTTQTSIFKPPSTTQTSIFKPPSLTQPVLPSGQVTITPTPKQDTNLFGVNSTSQGSGTQSSQSQSFEKYSAIFNALKTDTKTTIPTVSVVATPFQQAATSVTASATPVKPFSTTTTPSFSIPTNAIPLSTVQQTLPANKPLSFTTSAPLIQTKSGQQQATPDNQKTAEKPDIESNKTALYNQLITDEISQLESEMKVVLSQNREIKINVGTEDEKVHLVTNIDDLEEFIRDIDEICVGQNAEVHTLKQNLIQSWAWFEEARSRYNSTKDESMTILLKALPLDSASEKHLNNIKHSLYYLETQLSQANKALDEQWDDFQDYAKKSYRKNMPTMETIFQTMVRQNIILQKQIYVLKDINSRLKGHKRSGLILDSIQDGLSNLSLTEPENICKIQYERFLNRTKPISKSKTEKLREMLVNHKPLKVSAAKSFVNSAKKTKETKEMISRLLEAQQTPVVKESVKNVVKNLNFGNVEKTQTPPNTPIEVLSEKSAPQNNLTFNFNKTVPTSYSTPKVPISSNKWGLASSTNIPSSTFTIPTVPPTPIKPAENFGFKTSSSSNLITSTPKPPVFNFSSTISTTTQSASVSSATSTFKFNSAPKLAVTTTTQSIVGSISSSISAPVISSTTSTSANEKAIKGISDTTVASAFGNNVFASSSLGKSAISTSSAAKVDSKSALNSGVGSTFGLINLKTAEPSKTTTETATQEKFKMPEAQSVFGNTAIFGKPNTSAVSSTSSIFGATTSSSPSIFSIAAANSIKSSSSSIFGTPTTESVTKTVETNSTTTDSSTTSTTTVTETTKNTDVDTTAASKSIFNISFGGTSKPMFAAASEPATSTLPTTSTLPIFGTKSSIFGGTSSVTNSTGLPSIFGATASISGITSNSAVVSTAIDTAVTSTVTSIETTSSLGDVSSVTVTAASDKESKPLIFGSAAATTSSTSTSTTIFGSATESGPTTTASSIFGSAISSTTPVFGTSTVAVTTTSVSSPIFGTATTKSSIFGGPIMGSASPTTATSIFGGPVASNTTPTTTAPIFGGSVVSSSSPINTSSIFGSSVVSTKAPTTSIFDGSASGATPTTATSIFGAVSTSTSLSPTSQATTPSFGTPATTSSIFASSATPIFGAATATTNPATSTTLVFGNAATTTPSTSSTPFGINTNIFANAAAASTPATTQSIFGGQTTNLFAPKTTTTSTIFGGANTASSPFASQPVFGSPTSTASSPFAAVTNTQSVFGSSAFGGAQTTAAHAAPVFGQPAPGFESPAAATSATTNVFGSPAITSSATTFGGGAVFGAAVSSASPFGTPSTASNVFGSASAQPSSFSFASAGSNQTASSFGFGGLNVGATTTSGSIFGGSGFGQTETTTANPFGKTENKSIFGGSPATSTPSIFGSPTNSGFGGSSFGSSSFGQPATFGGSAFGGSGFGTNAQSAGPFSSGGAAVAQTGFGSPTASFQKPAFGAAPVFGGSPQPSFGGSPSFGGAPTFGAASSFGSPNKVFGAATPTDTFGQQATQNAAFGNLANQNTVGFGNLAQQTNQSNSSPFSSGSSSFSSWR